MTTQKLRLILLGSFAACVVVFIAVCFLGLSFLQKKSHSMVELKQESKNLSEQADSLNKAKKEVDKYKYFNDVARTVIPNDKDQVQAVADIFRLADESGIMLQNLAFPASTLGSKPVAAAPAAGQSGAAAAPTPTPAANAKDAISQAKPVSGISGLYSIELTITPQSGTSVPDDKQVTYQKLLTFLDKIERNRRTAQITQVSIQPQNNSSGISQNIGFTLNLNIFIKP